jgi:arylsulfatase A-like enzyme
MRARKTLSRLLSSIVPLTLAASVPERGSAAQVPGAAKPAAASRPPNVVVIYTDDMGYGDMGAYGARAFRTPRLDRLASEGVRLTHFYSVSPVCTPSRAALMTGRYAARMGIRQMNLANVLRYEDHTGLPTTETTLAAALRARGYATAMVGKWHLGHVAPHRPIDHGFDSYFGIPYSNDMQPSILVRGGDVVEQPVQQDTLTRRYTEEAVAFIAHAADRPFFLYLAHNMPHIPLHAAQRFLGKSQGGLYGDVMEEIDWSVGEVLDALERRGASGDTIVVFASDNGPWYQGSPGPLRGRKGWTTDGGVRVPGIVRWPAGLRGGRTLAAPLATIDLFPTLLAAAGESDPQRAARQPLDGANVLPVLRGEAEAPDRLLLFFDKEYLQTARAGRYKLHLARWDSPRYTAGAATQKSLTLGVPELYDMTVDDGESYDVAARHPDVVAGLRRRVAERLRSFPEEIRQANAPLLGEGGEAKP